MARHPGTQSPRDFPRPVPLGPLPQGEHEPVPDRPKSPLGGGDPKNNGTEFSSLADPSGPGFLSRGGAAPFGRRRGPQRRARAAPAPPPATPGASAYAGVNPPD